MASRLITLPITVKGKDDNGNRIEEPHLFGVAVDGTEIQTNYHDVAKVMVTAPDKNLADLSTYAKAHFAKVWNGR